MQAARDGRLDIVKNKLAKSKLDVDMRDDDNSTALHYAVRFNNIEVVKYLIKKGASMLTIILLSRRLLIYFHDNHCDDNHIGDTVMMSMVV